MTDNIRAIFLVVLPSLLVVQFLTRSQRRKR